MNPQILHALTATKAFLDNMETVLPTIESEELLNLICAAIASAE